MMIERPEFVPFPKIPRMNRHILITEKIDGTNASVHVSEDGQVWAASRNRWLEDGQDNYAWRAWVMQNKAELLKLGQGTHFGEWWGVGINRAYGKFDRSFHLFNALRWDSATPERTPPTCCSVVPVLYSGDMDHGAIRASIDSLRSGGSVVQPGFMRPEGVVVFHSASRQNYKILLENDHLHKEQVSK
jgi:hypothetical protein